MKCRCGRELVFRRGREADEQNRTVFCPCPDGGRVAIRCECPPKAEDEV